MKSQKKPCYVLAVGFIVLFFWCIGIYWINVFCNRITSDFLNTFIPMPEPKELKVWTPGTSHHPGTLLYHSGQSEFFATRQTGIVHFIQTLEQQHSGEYFVLHTDNFSWFGFVYDEQTKQLLVVQTGKDGDKRTQKIVGYIGPKGYSATPNSDLGTFERPQLVLLMPCDRKNDLFHFYYPLYDPAAHRFYRIEMDTELKHVAKNASYFTVAMDSIKIIEGPILNQPDWDPVQIYSQLYGTSENEPDHGNMIVWKEPYNVIRQFHPAYADQYAGVDPNTIQESEITYTKSIPLENSPKMSPINKDLFILHQNGRIDYLDGKTLNVVRCAGYLPDVGFYQNNLSRYPSNMANYETKGFYDPNGVYLGMAVAAVSRDGVMMAMDFYDTKGILSAHKTISRDPLNPDISINYESGIQFITDTPNGPFLLTIRYLLENLQPPLLRLLDMPAASWMEPDERYGTFFVHPNSFVGLMKFEYDRFGFWIQLLFLMLPSLAVSLWLSFKARQKAASLGYDTLAMDGWFIAVLAFGIPAYITFRLMLPKEQMVTCANCGNPRRVEFEACQSCKRDWQKTKSLTTAPDWAVRDTVKTAAENPSASSLS